MPNRLQRRLAEIGAPADVRELAAELAEQALRDPLTGLYNRRFFNEALAQNIESARRYNRELSLVLFDLDRFKEVNDTLGHQAGDAVLKTFSALLVKNARKADIICRIGGDEFAVLFPETDLSKVWKFIDRFFKSLEDLTVNRDEVELGSATAGQRSGRRQRPPQSDGNERSERQCTQIESPPAEGCPTAPAVAFGEGWKGGVGFKISASAGVAALPSENLFTAADSELIAAKRTKHM